MENFVIHNQIWMRGDLGTLITDSLCPCTVVCFSVFQAAIPILHEDAPKFSLQGTVCVCGLTLELYYVIHASTYRAGNGIFQQKILLPGTPFKGPTWLAAVISSE